MMVIPYKNNIRSFDYFHPHVDRYGSICWGDALSQVTQWISIGKLSDTLKMLYSLLFNYNDRNPYISIQDMKRKNTKYGRATDTMRHPDKKKKVKEEEVAVPNIFNNVIVVDTISSVPEFHIGDRVECEQRLDGFPRWNSDEDVGTHEHINTGSYIQGTVISIDNVLHTMTVDYVACSDVWTWPLEGHSRYSPDQWNRPGYLRHVAAPILF
jgi:hypothetical protein